MATNAGQPSNQAGCVMEWLNSPHPEAGLIVMVLGLIYWLDSRLDSRISGLNSHIEDLESRVDELEEKVEDADLDDDDWRPL